MNDSTHGYGAAAVDPQFDQATFRPVKPLSAKSNRWQFSLRSMVIGMTLAAIVVAMFAIPPLGLSLIHI